jgi:hypothetical protein
MAGHAARRRGGKAILDRFPLPQARLHKNQKDAAVRARRNESLPLQPCE